MSREGIGINGTRKPKLNIVMETISLALNFERGRMKEINHEDI